MKKGGVTRREFLKRMGILTGGIVVYITVGEPSGLAQPSRSTVPTDFNAFLRIGVDGRVTCFTGKIEMGQGIVTSLAQMIADELDVPFDSIDMVMGDTDLCPWDFGTFGSLSTRQFGPILREAAAEARAVLIELAAEYLKTPPKRLRAKDGVIFDQTRTTNRVAYAELAKGKRIERHLNRKPTLKTVSEFTVMGEPFLRRDALEKVTGGAKYAGDIRLPGMLYAKILRPPAHGARLKSVDTSGARQVKGVLVFQDGDLIAVLHEHPDEAEKALEKVQARYELPEPTLDNSTIFQHLLDSAPPGEIVTKKGNLEDGKNLAAKTFESVYFNHYVAHAPIEPHTAVVHIVGKKATVWASTQTPFGAQKEVARTLDFPSQNVRVITPFVGGGFGGKTRNQQVGEAARLAKLAGRPVQVAWSRKEEFFYDTFRPAAVIKVRSGLDGANRIVYWDYENYFAGERSSQPFYDIPHHRVVSRGSWSSWTGGAEAHPFAVGAWRGPASNTNVFAMESQIDIMAEAAGMDPLEFRLKNLTDKRMRRALRAAAEKFERRFAKAPTGRGYGIACTDYQGTYVATIAEVEVDEKTGKIRVERVVCAQDMGQVINPQGAALQIEGCITMGLGYVLTEEIRFKGGKILDENFDTYELPRFSWLPRIETVLIENPEIAPQGCGEPAITPMGAVIANAIYDAVGVRLFQLPMTPKRIKEALSKA